MATKEFFEKVSSGGFNADQMAYFASLNDKYTETYTNNQGKLVGIDAQGGHWELTDADGKSVSDDSTWYDPGTDPADDTYKSTYTNNQGKTVGIKADGGHWELTDSDGRPVTDDAAWYAPGTEPGAEPNYYNAEGDTGWDNDTRIMSYYDPIKGYTTKDFSNKTYKELNAWKEENGVGRYINSAGDYVIGVMPTSTYMDTENQILMEGVDPNWRPTVNPDRNGMGDDGGTRRPDNVTDWSGSASHDINGNIIPGSQADPNAGAVYDPPRWPDPPTGNPPDAPGTDDWLGGGGYGGGVTPTTGNNNSGNQSLPGLTGYESSTNKDYYQKQFQNLRAQTMRQQGAEQLASQYEAPEQQAPGDPWEWAGGSEQFNPSISDGSPAPAADWSMNSQYEGMDDASIARQAMTLGAFNEEDSRLMEGFLPQMEGTFQFRNSGSPGAFAANNSGLAPKNLATMGKIMNQVYSQGQSGPTVAPGYANPISPAGGQ
jgi:hypothetical protein